MKIKLFPVFLTLTLAAGCESNPDFETSEPTVVESPDASEKALEARPQAPETIEGSWSDDETESDPIVDETTGDETSDDSDTGETSEDPGCYYAEDLHVEVAELRQTLLRDEQECDEKHPLDEVNYETQYYYNNLCKFEAGRKLARDRENVIEDCFDEDTQWFHEDYCASRLAVTELNACLNGKANTIETWDACWVLRDIRYDDAMASGECSL